MADNIQATPRNYFGGLLTDAYKWMQSPERTQQMQGFAGLLGTTGVPQTIERMAYGEPLTNIGRANVPLLKPETADALMTVAPMVGPAARGAEAGLLSAGRAGERYAERVVPQIMERGGMPAQLLGDLSQGSIRPMDVYHGSPYRFKKFDPSKARTGEGNASYGEGAYLAQARGTGETYRKTLAKENQAMDLGTKLNMVDVGGTPLTKFNVDQSPELLDAAKAGKTEFVDLAKSKLNRWEDMSKDSSYPFPDYAKEKITAYKGLLDATEKGDVSYTGSGFLYKVDLPDESIAKMLDWNKPLGQQSKEVQQAIEKTKSMLPPNAIDDLGGDLSLLYGKDVMPDQFLNTWESFGKPAGGENALAEHGVTGVRYLDQMSRDAGEGTSNFVVFPQYQDLLTIKEINDQAVGGLLGR